MENRAAVLAITVTLLWVGSGMAGTIRVPDDQEQPQRRHESWIAEPGQDAR